MSLVLEIGLAFRFDPTGHNKSSGDGGVECLVVIY